MYHTFQVPQVAIIDADSNIASDDIPNARQKGRLTTTVACRECRRKKTRCGGGQPCHQCTISQQPCVYPDVGRRAMPSRKVVDKLQAEISSLSRLCSRMFPGYDPHVLYTLSREQLCELMLSLKDTLAEPHDSPAQKTPDSVPDSIASDSLVALDEAPEINSHDEADQRKIKHIADDVNGLALSVSRPASYVGISSISAALKVIFRVAPQVQAHLARGHTSTALPSRAASPTADESAMPSLYDLPAPDVAQAYIEAYFKHIHVLVPMIDEEQFRQAYLYEERRDAPWLALLNVVLALGCLTAGTSHNEEHIIYYKRASLLLSPRSFGSGNLMALQAHGLLSGYYLHWLNRPNEANAVMGATMRMATAIGLHREYAASTTGRAEIPSDIRRRTWYSLVCLDTWACMTTGRPSFGRFCASITVQAPELPPTSNNAQYLASLKLLPLTHNIAFCTLATKVQDSLASKSIMPMEELLSRDADFVNWHNALPPVLRDIGDDPSHGPHTGKGSRTTACPDLLRTPRALMHWWYLTVRILMHRPYLISAALRLVEDADLSARELVAVERCRALAGEAISLISETCRTELMAGWNAVWLMYQAVMVPLISLFSYGALQQSHTGGSKDGRVSLSAKAEIWYAQVVTAINFFGTMANFSLAASKSKSVIEQLLEASISASSYQNTSSQPPATTVAAYRQSLASGMPPSLPPSRVHQGYYDTQLIDHSLGGEGFSTEGDNFESIWDEMNWERMSGTLDNLPFTDMISDSFGLADAFS